MQDQGTRGAREVDKGRRADLSTLFQAIPEESDSGPETDRFRVQDRSASSERVTNDADLRLCGLLWNANPSRYSLMTTMFRGTVVTPDPRFHRATRHSLAYNRCYSRSLSSCCIRQNDFSIARTSKCKCHPRRMETDGTRNAPSPILVRTS
jgi:hypothetical protein